MYNFFFLKRHNLRDVYYILLITLITVLFYKIIKEVYHPFLKKKKKIFLKYHVFFLFFASFEINTKYI